MPCNAHGHPPFCNCGWGGENHGSSKKNFTSDWSKVTSHTNPNASCPVCSTKVFFYRSPNGGSVFFDELGPPWQKHPCTDDKAYLQARLLVNQKNKNKNNRRKKKSFSWWPYPCHKVDSLPNGEGVCLYGEGDKRLYVKTKPSKIASHTPIWVIPARAGVGRYLISTFKFEDGRIKEFRYDAYSYRGLKQPEVQQLFQSTLIILKGD